MYRVLIADDEKNVCMLIKKLIDWEAMGLEVTAIAHNAVDAYAYIGEKRPDIVISDIRMPGFDGLELIRRSLDIGYPVDFIIISGYKQFEYAHKALGMGVEHYLLKPINKRELEAALFKILGKRQEKEAQKSSRDRLAEQLEQNKKKMRKHFLTNIMERGTKTLEAEDIQEKYECDFKEEIFQAFFIKIDCSLEIRWDLTSLLSIVEHITEDLLKEYSCEYINSTVKSGIITVLNYGPDMEAEIKNLYERLMRELLREINKFESFSVSLGVGRTAGGIEQIRYCIDSAVHAVKCRMKKGTGKIIYSEELSYREVDLQTLFGKKERQTLTNIMESFDYLALYSQISCVVQEIRQTPFYSPAILYDFLDEAKNVIIQAIKTNHSEAAPLEQMQDRLHLILDQVVNEDQLVREFLCAVEACMNELMQEIKARNQLPVRMAKQYIRDHFAENLNLEDVGEAIGLSQAYLSTMFKKEVGISFTDYVISCRMEEAKKLLKDRALTIQEVAERSGYQDSRYFGKVFLKVVGLKPSVYRKLYT